MVTQNILRTREGKQVLSFKCPTAVNLNKSLSMFIGHGVMNTLLCLEETGFFSRGKHPFLMTGQDLYKFLEEIKSSLYTHAQPNLSNQPRK